MLFAVVFLLLILLIWWLLTREESQVLTNEMTNVNGLQIPADLPQGGREAIDLSQPLPGQEIVAGLKAVAITFTERFGSFSNQDGSSNLASLSAISTARMKSFLGVQKEAQETSGGDKYYGIITKALLVEIIEQDEEFGRAKVVVSCQRQENKGTTSNPRVFYQDLTVKLVKAGDGWKVDFVEWGVRK